MRLGWVGFILALKALIPQEIQFRTKSRNVTPQWWGRNVRWVREPGSGERPLGEPRVWGLGHLPPSGAALGPLHPTSVLLG